MKLNPDCIRDILITIEDNTGFGKYMSYNLNSTYDLLQKYTFDEVRYHIDQCELSNLITKVNKFIDGSCLIQDLSPSGHQFLADIRSDNNWNKTKSIAKTVGTSLVTAIKEIATNVIAEVIKAQFQ